MKNKLLSLELFLLLDNDVEIENEMKTEIKKRITLV